jgi:branched-chain amino acid transport system substrate-binding protein
MQLHRATRPARYILSALLCAALPVGFAQNLKLLKVALVMPLSGNVSEIGKDLRDGAFVAAAVARKEFKNLGFDLQMSFYDDQLLVKTAKTHAKTILDDENVVATIGSFKSEVTLALANAFREANLAIITPSASEDALTDRSMANVDRIVARNDNIAMSAAQFMDKALKIKTIVLIDDGSTYGKDLTKALVKNLKVGGIKVLSQINAIGNKYEGTLNKIKSLQPDMIHLGFSSYDNSAKFMAVLRKSGIKANVMGTSVISDPLFLSLAGSDAKGIYYASYVGPVETYPTAAVDKLTAEYQAQLQAKPTSYSVLGYDAMNVALEGIRQAIKANGGKFPSRLEVQSAIRKVQMPDALSGVIDFNSYGDRMTSVVYIMRVSEDFKTKVVSIVTTTPSKK